MSSIQQYFEYYVVDPGTWMDKYMLTKVTSCSINRDLEAETLGYATIDSTEDISEKYVRAYLIEIVDGDETKKPLGTYLVQTPSISFDGKVTSISMDAYTPLMELKERLPDLGYSILKNTNIMSEVCRLTDDYTRAPVVDTSCTERLTDDFIANTDDNWLTFLIDLMSNAKYTYDLDEMGRILFSPKRDTASLRPIFTYNDDNSSILYPSVTIDRDLYGIPNVVEVVYSKGATVKTARVVNNKKSSPTSTVNRGREIVYRDTNPSLFGEPDQQQVVEYAKQILRNLSTLEYTVSYTHAYCKVNIGDCVLLNYETAGLSNIKAKVISQSIKCEPGCPVTEKAVFTNNLWR